ncbi:unnamed protein product (macronuclear) [Paramecium tetraurelia]|uniref:protein-tyrosine-phosphatase n=1 Tax=Paramecium tetraurelia TaxID=5888 RepID=A0C606_PARTE|nr:uncharacterized protein GSPATT00035352001 [Paramecium tetraurelia]CAK66223.1 unnamed protein product [Paramecium tetraurelia]|eukprot:XP_001433620.1 hypothetical protein (macronuclear) [Paramecium tetraurelia strain d4-2]
MEAFLLQLIRKPLLNQTQITLTMSQQMKEINDDGSKRGLFCRKKIKIDQNDNHRNYFDGISKVRCENEEQKEENLGNKNDMNLSFEEQKQDLILEYHLENSIQYISGETLVLFKMTMQVQNMKLNHVLLYDCRYQYEFQGGHIRGATHLNHLINLSEELFGVTQQSKKIVVLYCEFSIKRSKEKYFEIRQLDRSMNIYPKLTYKNLYILSKGYSEFYKKFQHMCNGCYVRMDDPTYEQELEQEEEIRNIAKQKNKLKQIQRITGCLI